MKYLLILFNIMSFSAIAGDLEPFTLNKTIEGYRISIDCNNGECDGKASKFIFSDTFKAKYTLTGSNAVISIDDMIKAILKIDLNTGVFSYKLEK